MKYIVPKENRIFRIDLCREVVVTIRCLSYSEGNWAQPARLEDVIRGVARSCKLTDEAPKQLITDNLSLEDPVKHGIARAKADGFVEGKGTLECHRFGIVWLTEPGKREADRELSQRLLVDAFLVARIQQGVPKARASEIERSAELQVDRTRARGRGR
jgi:hypothetical protein